MKLALQLVISAAVGIAAFKSFASANDIYSMSLGISGLILSLLYPHNFWLYSISFMIIPLIFSLISLIRNGYGSYSFILAPAFFIIPILCAFLGS